MEADVDRVWNRQGRRQSVKEEEGKEQNTQPVNTEPGYKGWQRRYKGWQRRYKGWQMRGEEGTWKAWMENDTRHCVYCAVADAKDLSRAALIGLRRQKTELFGKGQGRTGPRWAGWKALPEMEYFLQRSVHSFNKQFFWPNLVLGLVVKYSSLIDSIVTN